MSIDGNGEITFAEDEPGYLRVEVESVEWKGGTVAIGTGWTVAGTPVTFAGEPRALHAIAEALADGERPVALVPDWAIL